MSQLKIGPGNLPQGNTNSHRHVAGIPTDKERQEYEKDIEAQKKGFVPDHVEHRIKRYEHLYTSKRDKPRRPT